MHVLLSISKALVLFKTNYAVFQAAASCLWQHYAFFSFAEMGCIWQMSWPY